MRRAINLLCVFLVVASASRQASLVTWNLLAPQYAVRSKFPWASDEVLRWEARRQLIVRQLAAMDADALCLQEVEVALWDELQGVDPTCPAARANYERAKKSYAAYLEHFGAERVRRVPNRFGRTQALRPFAVPATMSESERVCMHRLVAARQHDTLAAATRTIA